MSEKLKLLLCEDNVELRYLQTLFLQKDFSIIEASDGLEAIELLASHPDVKIIVTDLAMPRCNGLELVRRLEQSRIKEQYILIIYSGEPNLEELTSNLSGVVPIHKSESLFTLKQIIFEQLAPVQVTNHL